MNSIKYSVAFLILIVIAAGCRKQPREIILRSAIKMDTLKEVTYEIRSYRARDAQKKSNGTDTATAICYFDFDKDIPIMNARYYFNSNSTEYFFDGEKSVNIDHDRHHIITDMSPNKFSLLRSYFITYSLHSMKNTLAALIDNPNAELTRAADTTINEKKCYNLEIRLRDQWIDMLDGNLMEAENQNPFYRLLIDKNSRFPVQFTYYNERNEVVRQSTFKNISLNVKPDNLTWSSENLNDTYIEFTDDEFRRRLVNSSKTSEDNEAPVFELSDLDGGIFNLESSKKPVLLVFWFPGCAGCEEVIDNLSGLKNEIPSGDILLVEITNRKESEIRSYVESNAINLPVLINGRDTSTLYGITSSPTYILIGRDGIIKYRGTELDESHENEVKESFSTT